MKAGKISIFVILVYLGFTLYEIFFRPYPLLHRPWFDVLIRVWYYLCFYGALFVVSLHGFKLTTFRPDKFALLTLSIYSLGKFIYYLFIINYDMPTYISWCNSKPIALSTSLFLWSFALIIWYKRFKINKLLNKNGYGGRN